MKNSFILNAFWVAILGFFLCYSAPVFGESHEDLNKALDLVHQAWNPAGDPPSNAQRTDLLTQALKLVQDSPERRTRRHRKQAIEDIKTALSELQSGDPDHKATDAIRDADSELRSALAAVD